jgi:hypothetical protein
MTFGNIILPDFYSPAQETVIFVHDLLNVEAWWFISLNVRSIQHNAVLHIDKGRRILCAVALTVETLLEGNSVSHAISSSDS